MVSVRFSFNSKVSMLVMDTELATEDSVFHELNFCHLYPDMRVNALQGPQDQ